MISERGIRAPAAAPRPRRSPRGRRRARPPSPRARGPSLPRPPRAARPRPWRRNAPTIPVRTSPVPAVASAGQPGADDRALARSADERVAPLQQHDAAEPLDRPVERLQPVRVDPGRLDAEQARQLARSAASARSARRARTARDRRARRRRRRPADRSPRAAAGRAPAARRRARDPGPIASAPGAPDRVEHVLERPLHGLEHERLEHRDRLGAAPRRDVARVGPERRPRRRAPRAPVIPREPPTTSTEPAVYLLSRGDPARNELEDVDPGDPLVPRRRAARARCRRPSTS